MMATIIDTEYCFPQNSESSLQHKVDVVTRLEQKASQMSATIRDVEDRYVILCGQNQMSATIHGVEDRYAILCGQRTF
jgi:hypothetical protein